ncbi:MAG: peptidoglycan editing factor PgeF [Lysobacterales bacterium CG02_land_8_20_14_3_00_62_12]|nr:MAG: peptidoglycan editing factor PgeF [Xanthomonadales bacterium CG02_land_8_20_14_3_00_62_12]
MNGWITPDWPTPKRIHAASSTRQLPGCSQPPFERCNLADHVGDQPAALASNRAALGAQWQLPSEPRWLHQVHGKAVWMASAGDRASAEPPTADASVSRDAGVVLAILTADCLPILLGAQDGNEVAAIHAGWRGLAAGVIEATVARMQTPPSRLLAWLGPAIGPKAFVVGDEVRLAMMAVDAAAVAAFSKMDDARGSAPKWLCDLYLLARQRLGMVGVDAVYGGGLCTYSDADRFYSYRRQTPTGRMASLIWMG